MPWGDKTILDEIIRQSAAIPRPLQRKFQRFATSIGLVETGGRNLRGGDADSENFRQERASVYGPKWARTGGPLNTPAIVRRLRHEFLQQFDPGETAAQVAAQVQRPAAQYRGRYAQAMPEAIRVLRAAGGTRGDGGGGLLLPSAGGSRGMPQGSEGIVALLAALGGQERPQIASAGVQGPEFSAGPALAGATPSSGGGPAAPRPDIGGLLAAIQTAGGDVPGAGGGAGDMLVTGGAARGAGGAGRGRAVLAPSADRAGVRTKPYVLAFARAVQALAGGDPITIGTGTAHSRLTVNGNVSNHWTGDAGDVPASGARLIELGQAALIAAGADPRWARKQKGGLYNINGAQIIFNTQEGGDHTDHLHFRPPPKFIRRSRGRGHV